MLLDEVLENDGGRSRYAIAHLDTVFLHIAVTVPDVDGVRLETHSQ